MAEIWGAAIAVGGSLLSGAAASKKDKADKKHEAAMTKEESALAAQRMGYEKALENYYTDEDRYQKQRGLDEFRKFATIGRYAPGYSDADARVAQPVMPTYGQFANKVDEDDKNKTTPTKATLTRI